MDSDYNKGGQYRQQCVVIWRQSQPGLMECRLWIRCVCLPPERGAARGLLTRAAGRGRGVVLLLQTEAGIEQSSELLHESMVLGVVETDTDRHGERSDGS